MKKLLILAVAITFLTVPRAHSQIINPGFEIWVDDALVGSDTVKDPNTGANSTGWWDFNMLNSSFGGGSPVSIRADSNHKHSGKYSARISTVALTTTSWGYLKSVEPTFKDTLGIVISGTLDVNLTNFSHPITFTQGIPFTARLDTLDFYYLYAPAGIDTAYCTVSLTKNHIPVGGGIWHTSIGTGSSWQLGKVAITTSQAPDSITIIFSSSGLSSKSKPKVGSTFWVDDVYPTVTGINEIGAKKVDVDIYPNPANTMVHFGISGETVNTVEVYDITGKMVSSYPVRSNYLNINTLQYNSGIYFYRLLDKSGALLKTGKFSVVK